VPSKSIAEGRTWTGDLTINGIKLGVSLDGAAAPQVVSSTIALTQKKFYDGLTCHRLTNGGFYVLQSGNANSQGSQFFIVYKDTTIPSDSAGGYTVIGTITSGLDTLVTDVADKG